MRKNSENLYDLIKALDKNEKRYFRKFASSHKKEGKGNKLLVLYDAIEKLHEDGKNNEKMVKDSLASQPLLNQLSVAKNYLFRNILKALYLFNSNESPVFKFSNMLHDVVVLYNKGLYKESWKQLQKLKNMMFSQSRYEFYFECIRWEMYLAAILYPDELDKLQKNSARESSKIINYMNNILEYRKLCAGISKFLRDNGYVRNSSEQEKLDGIFSKPLMKSYGNALTFESKMLYLKIYIIYYLAKSDDARSYKYSRKMTKLIEDNPLRLTDFMKEYVFSLNNQLLSVLNLSKYDESLQIIDKLKCLKIKAIDQREYVFVFSSNAELFIYIALSEFEKGKAIIPAIEQGLKKYYKGRITIPLLIFYFNSMYVNFALDDFGDALGWLNRILNSRINARNDIMSLAHIMNLIIHFELGNMDLLEYIVKNTYRFLYKRKKLYKFEKLVLHFIRNLYKYQTQMQLIEAFKYLRSRILLLENDVYERSMLEFFDFVSWLDSKIENKSFIEIKKRKRENGTY